MEIEHLTIPVSNYQAGKSFYADLLEPLGYRVLLDWPDRRRAYLGVPPEPSSIWVVESVFAGAVDLSLRVADAAAVAVFHSAGIAAGGRSLGEPGANLDRSPEYYSARIADFDGNVLEAVCRVSAAAERSRLAA